jgi:hypothetical protein
LLIYYSFLFKFIDTRTSSSSLGDEELDQLIKATIAGGGVIPHIHKSLIGGRDKEEGEGDEGTDQADTEGGGTEGDNTQ